MTLTKYPRDLISQKCIPSHPPIHIHTTDDASSQLACGQSTGDSTSSKIWF